MKNKIYMWLMGLITLVMITSCESNLKEVETTNLDGYDVVQINEGEVGQWSIQVREFNYKNHRYILFDLFGVVHSPECECFNTNTTQPTPVVEDYNYLNY